MFSIKEVNTLFSAVQCATTINYLKAGNCNNSRIDGSIELHLNSKDDGEITKNVERADMGLFCSIGINTKIRFFFFCHTLVFCLNTL